MYSAAEFPDEDRNDRETLVEAGQRHHSWQWFALIVMCTATFVSDMSRGIVIPSLLPFVQRVRRHVLMR